MIIIQAKVKFYNGCIITNRIRNDFRCTILLSKTGFVTSTSMMGKEYIGTGRYENVEITLLYGELELEKFKIGAIFHYVAGSENIGDGIITKIQEIYIFKNEYTSPQLINALKLKLSEIESLEYAVIEEGMQEYLNFRIGKL